MVKAINGRLREGDLVQWQRQGQVPLFIKIARIDDGGLSIGSTGEKTQGAVIGEIVFPFEHSSDPKKVPVFQEFLRIIDPEAEDHAENIISMAARG